MYYTIASAKKRYFTHSYFKQLIELLIQMTVDSSSQW